jgi:hypothetical protein
VLNTNQSINQCTDRSNTLGADSWICEYLKEKNQFFFFTNISNKYYITYACYIMYINFVSYLGNQICSMLFTCKTSSWSFSKFWYLSVLSAIWFLRNPKIFWNTSQGSPHIVKTGRLDFSLSWLKGEVREFWETSENRSKF